MLDSIERKLKVSSSAIELTQLSGLRGESV